MRFILIANNKKLNQKLIDQAGITSQDTLIVFNYMWPFFNFDAIRNHPNKIFIGRQRPIKPETVDFPYAGIDLVRKEQDNFQEIIFHSHPRFFSNSDPNKTRFQRGIDIYGFDSKKFNYLEPISNGARERIGYPKGKNMSTGIIAYDYFQNRKNKNDDILLVGFTSELARSFHNDNWEVNFFRNEIDNNKCQAIGCCNLEKEKYNHIYDKLRWKSYLTGNHGDKSKDIVDILKPKNILDVGCGANLFCKSTIKNIECLGLDFAGPYKDIYGDLCIGFDDISDKQFDLVTCFDTMEHLLPSCVDIALSEMQRVSNRFLFQIDYNKESILYVFNSPLHQTVKSKAWWHRKIKEYSSSLTESGKYISGIWKTTT